ncbi:MAG: ArsC/Spx/MgsR family protein [Amylibacter sp.]
MKVNIYGLKSCDTCKKALKTLQEAGHDVTYTDVRANGIGADKLAKFQCEFGQALINTRSTTWRDLSADKRTRPVLQLLLEYPTLMKRPVIDADGVLSLGWGKDVQDRFRP